MVVGQDIGDIGIAAGEQDGDFEGARGRDIRDRGQIGLRGGFRILRPVQVERIGDIPRRHGLLVMEGDPVAELEDPFLGVGTDIPAFREMGNEVPLLVEVRQRVIERHADEGQEGAEIGLRVQTIRAAGSVGADDEMPTFLGRVVRPRRCRSRSQSQASQRRPGAQPGDEFTPMQPAPFRRGPDRRGRGNGRNFLGHGLVPCRNCDECRWTQPAAGAAGEFSGIRRVGRCRRHGSVPAKLTKCVTSRRLSALSTANSGSPQPDAGAGGRSALRLPCC